ncbi:MAG TPA: hypothetical protein VM008_09345, partial [Phycisphaerae bacterium]|nr:hypothetical protein [Phycisphaerae bacterium]
YAPPHLPPFTFNSPHSQFLLDFFRSHNIPLEKSAALLAPNAYHYRAETNLIINQYPPGIPLFLSVFPQGHALHSVHALVAAALLLFCLTIFILALRPTPSPNLAPKAALIGFTALTVSISLLLFGISVSYSIDFFALPILLIFLAIHFALRTPPKIALPLTLLAGALFGFAILSRLATLLFLPGFLLLLWQPPKESPRFVISHLSFVIPALFAGGLFITGILPLAIHNNALTGSPFRSTYSSHDAAPPSLSHIPSNLAYYTTGDGSTFSLLTAIALTAFIILLLSRPRSAQTHPESQRLSRYARAIALFILIPTAFFLTHPIATDYYQLPTLIVTLFAFTFALIGPALQPTAPPDDARCLGQRGAIDAPPATTSPQKTNITNTTDITNTTKFSPTPTLAASLLLAATLAWYASTLPAPPASIHAPTLNDPEILHDPNAWIFADRFTGTLWYYHAIPATELLFSDPDTRWQTLQFIASRHTPPDPIYILIDNPAIQPALQDLTKRGATLTPAGTFAEQPIAQLHMP